ncbi:hypothetical protein [uncultured Winogradskyella sp.]|uniref:hypothetical protein n=1 Tax=uncultured Winogradskyella sp. TaxID=395353 RepID=UPI0030DBBD30|tara:strand:+ start:1588 stop:2121 length:534 start_codon:yes stop_codon:yes gene_type:complete
MKLLKKATYAMVFAVIVASTFQCASHKEIATTTFEEQTPFKVKPVYFQEWYAGIKVGGTGINIYVPVVNKTNNVQLDSIYFRNLKGKLIEKGGRYSALLKNKAGDYTFKISESAVEYPFTLLNNECAISYIENGETKYLKISKTSELAGIYYENGPPSIYTTRSSTVIATLDDEHAD